MKRPAGMSESEAAFEGATEGDSPELAAATARGLADAAAGRVVPHAEVKAWLLKLARGEQAPRPRPRKPLAKG